MPGEPPVTQSITRPSVRTRNRAAASSSIFHRRGWRFPTSSVSGARRLRFAPCAGQPPGRERFRAGRSPLPPRAAVVVEHKMLRQVQVGIDLAQPLAVLLRPPPRPQRFASLLGRGPHEPGTALVLGAAHTLGHVDRDACSVSAERVRNCFLLGKPVGALGNPSACVSAKSYDLKAANRNCGEPIGEGPREKRPARQGDGPGHGERPPAATPGVKFKKGAVLGLPAGKEQKREPAVTTRKNGRAAAPRRGPRS
jgi:hypothetical protein